MIPFKRTKTYRIIEGGSVAMQDRDQSKVPRSHRSIAHLIKNKRSRRIGSKPDIGQPGKPEGW